MCCTPKTFLMESSVGVPANKTPAFLQLRRDAGLHSHRLPGAHGPRHCLLGLDLPLLYQTGYYYYIHCYPTVHTALLCITRSLLISPTTSLFLDRLHHNNPGRCFRSPATWTSRWWTCPSCSAPWPSWRAWCSTATASTTGWRKRSPWDSSSGTCKCEHTHTHRGTLTHSDTVGRWAGGKADLCSQQPGGGVCRSVSMESEWDEANNELLSGIFWFPVRYGTLPKCCVHSKLRTLKLSSSCSHLSTCPLIFQSNKQNGGGLVTQEESFSKV